MRLVVVADRPGALALGSPWHLARLGTWHVIVATVLPYMSPRPRPPCRSVPTRPRSCKSRFYDIGTARSSATTSPNGTHRRAAVDPLTQTALRASPRHPCVHCIDICARSIGSMLHASVTDARGSPRTDTITSSRARVDHEVVDEEHPPSSTGRPDTMLTGDRGGAEAQMPSEARVA